MNKYLDTWKEMIECSLKTYLHLNLGSFAGKLEKAMNYAVFPGGKRIRPLLTMASAHACGLMNVRKSLPAACAIELIHSYSLVHDDLPSMDNDNFRRGKPTVHRRFGKGAAILAGDALLTIAFHVMSDNSEGLKAANSLLSIKILSEAAGAKGMIAGQCADTFFERRITSRHAKLLDYIHAKKTGALISASVTIGGAVAGADKRKMKALKFFGDSIGLAFQIIDDIFDMDKNRITYPAVYGLEASREKAERLVSAGLRELNIFGGKAVHLRSLAEFVVERKY